MKRNCLFLYFFLSFMTAFTSVPCFADYKELKNDFETYTPPVSLENPPEKSGMPDAASDAQKTKTRKLAPDLQKSADASRNKYRFLRPKAGLLKKLRPAARSSRKAAAMLRKNFSLETLEVLVLLRNPGIKAADRKVRAAAESFSQATELDEILLKYSAFTQAIMNGVGPMKGMDSLDTKFPFPGVAALRGQVAEQGVRAAQADLEIARRDAVTAVRKVYWNLLYSHRAEQVMTETLELFHDLESVADTRYRSGDTSFQDVIKVSIRTRMIGENLVTIRETGRNLRAGIIELLDLPPDTRIGLPAARTLPDKLPGLKKLYRLARENRQELQKMRAMVGKMERMTEMAGIMILPQFDSGFSAYENAPVVQAGPGAMKPSFATSTAASTGAGLPQKPWSATNQAWLRQTQQSLEALRADLQKAVAGTDNMVRNAWFELDKARRETALFQGTVTELSRSALDVSTRGYESGSVGFADVIGSYTDWLDVRLSLVRKQSDMGVAWAELARVTGVSMP